MELGRATWPRVEESAGQHLLAVPLGSTEQHGPHLPFDTDTRVADALARGLAQLRSDVVVAPALPYGASGEHAAFPGTLLIGHQVLAAVLTEIVRSARGSFRGVVLVCAHGGNQDALAAAQRRSTEEGDHVLTWSPCVPGGDAHAGRTETSLMLAIEAGAVRLELAEAGSTETLDALLPRLRSLGVRPVSSSGVLGDPAGASAEEGRWLLGALVADLAETVSSRWPS